MLRTLTYFLRIALVWLVIFWLAKVFFVLANGKFIADFLAILSIWYHGLRLDLSMVGYLATIPLLCMLAFNRFPKISGVVRWYWIVTGCVIILILAVDPYFFYYWGQKTNLGFTQFLGKENAGLSSIETKTYVLSLIFLVCTCFLFYRIGLKRLQMPKRCHIPTLIVLMALSALLIRGGLSKVPINISSAYFSQNNMYNNAAVNAVWSFLASELERDKHAPLSFFETDEEAKKIIDQTKDSSNSNLNELLKPLSDSTNVVLIVLESFTTKAIDYLSGNEYGATPHLDQILQNGICYTSAYAASFRSDKGLLALTTGIPSGARQTLTNMPANLARKPNIFSALKESHITSFYYGGNLEFANIKVLFKDADLVKSQKAFSSKNSNAWGVHDEDVFNTFTSDFIQKTEPQFSMIFSLSSHEPFDVPNFQKIEEPYLNSIAYTDSCLGTLIAKLKESKKWNNTLIIITADHGTVRLGNAPVYDTSNFRIPLVLTGGIVLQDTLIQAIVSQTDIASTIASYCNSPITFPQYSILQPANKAFYSYFNGLSYVSPECVQYYDLVQKKYLNSSCGLPVEKAYYHQANSDFFKN